MKKGMMKKIVASVLAAAMVFTSVNVGSFVSEADGPSTTITDAELVAQNFDELTAEEKAILTSGMVTSDSYTVSQPTDAAGLVTIDSDNRVIYADNYTAGGYTWIAESAQVLVDGTVQEEVVLTTNPEDASQTKGTFVYDENSYSVEVQYVLYIDVPTETQALYLNIPYYMADARNNMDNSIKRSTSGMNMIVNSSDILQEYVDGTNRLQITGEPKRVVESWIDQSNTYGKSLLAVKLSEGGYDSAVSKMANILAHGEEYKTVAVDTYTDNSYVITDVGVSAIAPDEVDMLAGVNENLEPAATSEWTILDIEAELAKSNESILVAGATDEEYTNFDALVKAAINKSEEHTTTITETALYADTVTLSCNVNRYNVAVTIQAEVVNYINGENIKTTLDKATITLDFTSGTSDDDILAALAANGIEANTVAGWNALADGAYAIDETNYVRTTTALPETLTEDITYVVSYTPALFTVDYEDAELTDETVPYGSVILFPKHSSDDKSYEYTIDGQVYEQGTEYRVTENVTVTRALDKAKEGYRVYDIVADNYADELTSKEAKILENLESEYIYVRMAGDDLISVDEYTLIAKDYNAGNGMYWKPVKATIKNGSTVVQEITSFTNGEATIRDDITYTGVEVAYQLKVDVTDAEVLAALNLPDTLSEDAVEQLADMKTLCGFEDEIDQITYGVLDLAAPKLSEASQKAILKLAENCCDADGYLLLSAYIDEYKTYTTKEEQLAYYYGNDMYLKLKNQATLVADALAVVVEDEALPDLLKDLGKEEYVEKLDTAAESIATLKEKFPAKNAAIDTTSSTYNALLKAIVAEGTTDVSSSANGLYLTTTFTKSDTYATVSITVKMVDANGNASASNVRTYSDSFKKVEGMSADALSVYAAKMVAFENELGINKERYTRTVTGALPEAGNAINNNIDVVYTWSPNSYTIKIEGAADQTVVYSDNMVIILPASSGPSYKYKYTIGSREIIVGQTPVTFNMNAELFEQTVGANANYVIKREVIDVQTDAILDLVAKLNAASTEGSATFIPYKDANGDLALVLRMNPLHEDFTASLSGVAQELLLNNTYVAFGGKEIRNNGIHANALTAFLLETNISTNGLNAIIGEDGNIVENAQTVLKNAVIIDDSRVEVNNTALGGLLTETTLNVGSGEIPLYITLQDFDQNADDYQKLNKALDQIASYVDVSLTGGEIVTTITAPEKAHEAYLAAMLAEGKLDINDFETPSLSEMVAYAYETIEAPLTDTSVKASTLSNTVSALGTDISAYEDTIDKVLKGIRTFIDKNENGSYFKEITEDNQAKDTYLCQASCSAETLLDGAASYLNDPEQKALISSLKQLLVEESNKIVVPARVILTNCNTEYEAFVVDPNADEAYNMVDFTKDASATIKDIKGNSIVVILNDITDTITTNNEVLFDLNGHSVAGLTAKGTTLVVDSGLNTENNAGIGTVSGGVKITAGTYSTSVEAYLPDGYVQSDVGVVSSRFFNVVESRDAAGNVTEVIVQLNADAMNTNDSVALETLAYDIATDLLVNVYTFGSLSVDGNDIYSIELNDFVSYLKDYSNNGAKATAKDILATLAEEVNCDGIEAMANAIIDDILDFAAIQNAISNDTSVAEYSITTAPWDLVVEKADAGDYMTVSLGTNKADAHTSTLKLVVTGDDSAKEKLAALCGELQTVFTTKDVDITVDDITFDPDKTTVSVNAGADVTIVADLTNNEYLPVIGVILAYGNNDTDMVAAVKEYVDNGANADLIKAIEASSTADVINAIKAARNTSFETMLNALGLEEDKAVTELADLYAEFLNIGAILIDYLELTGGSDTLAGCKEAGSAATYAFSKENWHKMNIDLTLILADEITDDSDDPVIPNTPVIVAPVKPQYGELVKGFDYDANAKEIYFDVAWNGIKDAQFESLIRFETTDAERYELTFNKDNASDYVCTGNTVTVTAYNGTQTDVETYTIIVVGDVNKDGWSTASDAGIIGKYAVGLMSIEGAAAKAANINRSTEYLITVSDAKLIQDKFLFQETYKSLFK